MSDFKFNLDSVSLIKADFLRQVDLVLSEKDNTPDINVKVSHSRTQQGDNHGLDVILNVDVLISNDDAQEQIRVSAEMLGVFIIGGEPPHTVIDYFGNVNAPAIIYPFVREVIANLTVKASIAPVLLPAMNFVVAYEERLSQKEEEKSTSEVVAKLVKPRAKRSAAKPKRPEVE